MKEFLVLLPESKERAVVELYNEVKSRREEEREGGIEGGKTREEEREEGRWEGERERRKRARDDKCSRAISPLLIFGLFLVACR